MNELEVFNRLASIISERTKINVVEIVMTIEEEFNISIPDEVITKLKKI